jgi:hypothetical protein
MDWTQGRNRNIHPGELDEVGVLPKSSCLRRWDKLGKPNDLMAKCMRSCIATVALGEADVECRECRDARRSRPNRGAAQSLAHRWRQRMDMSSTVSKQMCSGGSTGMS